MDVTQAVIGPLKKKRKDFGAIHLFLPSGAP